MADIQREFELMVDNDQGSHSMVIDIINNSKNLNVAEDTLESYLEESNPLSGESQGFFPESLFNALLTQALNSLDLRTFISGYVEEGLAEFGSGEDYVDYNQEDDDEDY